ncbi:MAG TPA: HD domain-containing phosphohydrolase [Terracidiphilus sp.]|nr:HD domain-containing phosphohydrolase [Terracidiphilus sp.]
MKALVCLVVAGAAASLYSASGHPSREWVHFTVYLLAILLSSGMKVALPRTESTMSVNFPFILLGILEMSPLQAVILAVSSVIAQCRFRVIKPFTLVQILFNVASVTTATVLACFAYAECLRLLNGEVTPALAVASTVLFVATSAPVTLILAWESCVSPLTKWRQEYLWYTPFYLVGAIIAATANFIGARFGWLTSLMLIPMVYIVYRAYCAQMAIVRDRERHILETEALHLRTIEALAMAVEAKDRGTHRHLMRVRVYVTELGKVMGLEKPLMQALTSAAFLHDIGKLAVPEHIINKPGKLTPEEFEKMKIHPVVGADILERINFPYPVVPIVRGHHEAWDGSGYPDGLKGEEIPIGARILTTVDCFDALASDRPYRKAMSTAEAMAFVKKRAGIQFDPAIVKLLEERYPQLEELARQEIERGMKPLKTDLFIERGAAPGNGFEPEPGTASASAPANAQPALLRDLVASAGREARLLFELSRLLGTSLTAVELSARISRLLQPLVPHDCLAVYRRQEDSMALLFSDGRFTEAFSGDPIPVGEGLSGWVAQSGRPILNGNPTVEPNFRRGSALFTENSSALSIPLLDLRGAVLGALTLCSSGNAAFSRDHLRALEAAGSGFSLALENALRVPAAGEAAGIDPLTGLMDARQFFAHVEARIAAQTPAQTPARTPAPTAEQTGTNNGAETGKATASADAFAVAVCDLNSFKSVNDRYGQFAGDALLRAIAREFRRSVSDAEALARTGGDEFSLLYAGVEFAPAEVRLQALKQAAHRACMDLEIDLDVSLCAGIAVFPRDGSTAEELLNAAQRRLIQRKQLFYEERRKADARSALQGSFSL